MKQLLIALALLTAIPAMADDCLDAGVRFRSFADTGGGEVYLGQPDLGSPDTRVEANFNWDSPGTYPFVFTYQKNQLEVEVNGVTLGYASLDEPIFTGPINTLLVDIASRDEDSTAKLKNLVVNGEPIDVVNPDGQLLRQVFRIDDVAARIITGEIVLTGGFSQSQELSRIEVRVGNDDCDLLPPVAGPPEPPEAIAVDTLGKGPLAILALLHLAAALMVGRELFRQR